MKSSFSTNKNFLFLFGTMTAFTVALPPVPNSAQAKYDFALGNAEGVGDLHRKLRSGANECRNDFVCPPHSERIYGKQCYDSFNECACLLGYSKNPENNACVAIEGLCSLEYMEMVADELAEIEGWIDMLSNPSSTPEERYAVVQSIDRYLPELWSDYNNGKASCEMFVFGDDDSNRRLLFSRIVNAIKFIGDGIKKAAKEVVKFVGKAVETIVNGVVQVVECGVGIVNDGARCGLIGCAFGLGGVAIDIAFTIATGGFNKFALSCSAVGDRGSLKTLLEGVGAIVCAVNKIIDSNVLGEVCEVAEALDEAPTGGVQVDGVTLRFLEAVKGAMCGNPGSAIIELLEEIVVCEIGCAEDDNVFCTKTPAPPVQVPALPAPRVPTSAPTPSSTLAPTPSTGIVVEYSEHPNNACRTDQGGLGKKGEDFVKIDNSGFAECEASCSEKDDCEGFEFNAGLKRCEIWLKAPAKFQPTPGFDCFVKI
jgi:hypothetical protein